MDDIEQRLREAHPKSTQYALGSNILLEGADRIKELEARVSKLIKAGDDMADSIGAVGTGQRKRLAVRAWDRAAIN